MKYKILVLLCAIALNSCFKSPCPEQSICFVDGVCGGEPSDKFYRYENCKLENSGTIYPCQMNLSLVHELVDLFGTDTEIVEDIKGGGFCDRFSNTERPFCNSSNPQNGCDTISVKTRISEITGFSYIVIRNEDYKRWEITGSGPWVQ